MRVLVLGGHGFVGTNLCEILKGSTHDVVALSRRDGLDLRGIAMVRSCFRDQRPDAVFNLAAHVGSIHYVSQYAADVVYDNMQMALNIYKAASELCPGTRVINALSNCSYPGDANNHYEPEWWLGEVHESVHSYGNAKRFTYVLAKNFKRQYGIVTVNFLVPNTFGPGDYTDPNRTHALNGMIIRMILAQRNGDQRFEIWGSGNPIREWGYIKDVVSVLKLGLTIETDLIYPVNIGQNKGYSIRESAEMIAREVGFSGNLDFNTKYQDGAPYKILDDRKFRELFPSYKFYDHRQGIKETVSYYRSIL
jgi:GDP-L-fucose synthase